MLSDDVKGYSVPGGQIRLIGIPCRKTYWDPIQSPFSWNIKVIPLTGNPGESCCEKFSPVGFVTGWYLNSYRQKRRNIIYNEKMGQACIVIRKFVNRWLTDLPISNGGSLNRNDMLFFFFDGNIQEKFSCQNWVWTLEDRTHYKFLEIELHEYI